MTWQFLGEKIRNTNVILGNKNRCLGIARMSVIHAKNKTYQFYYHWTKIYLKLLFWFYSHVTRTEMFLLVSYLWQNICHFNWCWENVFDYCLENKTGSHSVANPQIGYLSTYSRSNWNLECWVLWMEETVNPEENPRSKGENWITNSTHIQIMKTALNCKKGLSLFGMIMIGLHPDS